MASKVDPTKKTWEGFNNAPIRDDTAVRPSYNSVWTRQTSADASNQVYSPPLPSSDEQQQQQPQSQAASNKKPSFFNSLNRTKVRKSDSFTLPRRDRPIPQRLSANFEDIQAHHIEQEQNDNTGEDYAPEGEYYSSGKPNKKKGLSAKIDRLVHRIPALGKIYKQPLSAPYRSGVNQHFPYPQLSTTSADSNQLERELTVDELALNQRYTDKTRMKFILLQAKETTQPVDLRIHHQSNKIYSCDIGRSILEIFDLNGTLLHTIDDQIMLKFQPTAIAIAFDGTIIVASHFSHRLHMYSPNSSQNYTYKQFKLGTSGDQAHQFYHPAGIAIDHKDGFLYICDRGNYRIQVIRPEGVCERMIELLLNDKQKNPLDATRVAIQVNLDQLVCIVGNGDAICFIPKLSNGRYYVEPLYIVDENGLGIEGASGLAVDTHDRIFIADTAHHRIVICTPDGGYITSIGSPGDGLGQLRRPCGLDITDDGILVVTEPDNKRLQLFGLTTNLQL